MKKIFITEKQSEILKEMIIDKWSSSNSLYSEYENDSFEKRLEEKRFKKVYSIVEKLFDKESIADINWCKNTLANILSKCKNIENKNKDIFEKLCADTISDFFGDFTNQVTLECNIVDSVNDTNTKFHITVSEDDDIEYEDHNDFKSLNTEIEKRKLLSAIIIGGSLVTSKFFLKRCKTDIENIDKNLFDLYKKYIWLNEYILFKEKVEVSDDNPNQAGGVVVKLGNEDKKTKIESVAIIFPVLLYETIKGFFELFISHGLPNELNKAKHVIDHADRLIYEQYAMKIGPILWNNSISIDSDIDSKILPDYIMKLSEIDFDTLLNDICILTKKGRNILNNMLNSITNEYEYSDFEDRLKQKRNDKYLVMDSEYMTPEELGENEIYTMDDVLNNETQIPNGMVNSIPNELGINLCSVEGFEIAKQKDGQIKNIKINFIPESKDWELTDNTEIHIENIIKEELSINSDVALLSSKISSLVEDMLKKNDYKKEKIFEGVSKITIQLNEFVNEIKLNFNIVLYNFKDKNFYDKFHEKIDFSSHNSNIGGRVVFITIKGYLISGNLNKEDISDSIQHEINHIFQDINGKVDNEKERKLYYLVLNKLNNKNNIISKLAYGLYYSFNSEQDSYVNGLYAYLMNKGLIVPWDDIKRDTDAYNAILGIKEAISLINDNNIDNIIIENFSMNKKQMEKFLKNGLKRLEIKIGKVLIKHRKDYSLKEDSIKKIDIYEPFPYIHNFVLED